MTQNLDLCIGCEGTATLTSKNTDLNSLTGYYSGPYSTRSGYSEDSNIITWTPNDFVTTSERTTLGIENEDAVTDWWASSVSPVSAEGGDIYIYPSDDSTYEDAIYNSLSECIANDHSEKDCAHYQIGNYYNWTAAIASNNSTDIWRQYAVASNSICPAGWRLPKGKAASTPTAGTYEFGQLLFASDITPGLIVNWDKIDAEWYTDYQNNGFSKLHNFPLYFTQSGEITKFRILRRKANAGYYWSSTIINGDIAYYSVFDRNYINPSVGTDQDSRSLGLSVRCIIK